MIQVPHLVYTKVRRIDESPAKKEGYHIVFYPTKLIDKSEVLPRLGAKISLSIGEMVDHKVVVFHHQFQGDWYLVLLVVSVLKGEQDCDRRQGFYLAHGILAPPCLWKVLPTPLSLLTLLKGQLFESRQSVFEWRDSHPAAEDREIGNLSPLEISEDAIQKLSPVEGLRNELDLQLAVLLNRIATEDEDQPPVVVIGRDVEVEGALDRLIPYVPQARRVHLGWDPARRGDDLLGFPLPIAGFQARSTKWIVVDLESRRIDAAPENGVFLAASTPYERWLARCTRAIRPEDVEKGHAWSSLLLGESISDLDSIWLGEGGADFATVNSNIVREAFAKATGNLMVPGIAHLLIEAIEARELLLLLGRGLDPALLASEIVSVCLARRWQPEHKATKRCPPFLATEILDAAPALRVLHRVWRGEKSEPSDLLALPLEQRMRLATYFLVVPSSRPQWFPGALGKDPQLFEELRSVESARAGLIRLVEKSLASAKISERLVSPAVQEADRTGRLFDLFSGRMDALIPLDGFLRNDPTGPDLLPDILRWARRRRIPDGCPALWAFVEGREQAVQEVAKIASLRPPLLERLARMRGWSARRLRLSGFQAREILNVVKTQGRYIPGLVLVLLLGKLFEEARKILKDFRLARAEAPFALSKIETYRSKKKISESEGLEMEEVLAPWVRGGWFRDLTRWIGGRS